MMPILAVKIGRLCNGTAYATTTKAPVRIPALPHPAMARPIIKVVEFWATAQRRLPISNMTTEWRKVHLTSKRV